MKPAAGASPVRLRVVASAAKGLLGEEIPVPGPSASIGRGSDCDVVVPDTSVSISHARLEIAEDGSCLVCDNDSATGLFIGSRRVREGRVQPGHRFTLGATTFELVAEVGGSLSRGPLSGVGRSLVVTRIGDLVADLEEFRTLEEYGEEVFAAPRRPIAVSDPRWMWMVTSGKVHIALAGGEGDTDGARFLSVGPGQVFFGIDSKNFGFDWQFVARGQAELRRFRLSRIQLLTMIPDHGARIARMLSGWVEGLSGRLANVLPPAPETPQIRLRAGATVEMQPGEVAVAEQELVWIEMTDAQFLFDDSASLPRGIEGAFFPLAPGSRIELLPGTGMVSLAPKTTLDCIRYNFFWVGLNAFHRTLCKGADVSRSFAEIEQIDRLELVSQPDGLSPDVGDTVMVTMIGELDAPRSLEEQGEEVLTTPTRPILATDSNSMWMVTSGNIHIALEGSESSTPFLTVEPGQVFFGIDARDFGFDWQFIARSRGARLRRLSLDRIVFLFKISEHRERIARLVDEWVQRLSARQARDLPEPPVRQVTLRAGEASEWQPGQVAATEQEVVWLEMPDAEFLFDDLASLSRDVEGTLFPVAPRSWMELLEGTGRVRVAPSKTHDSIDDARLWAGLHVFHRILCACADLSRDVSDASQIERLERRAKLMENAREEAKIAIASVMPGGESRGQVSLKTIKLEPLLDACRLVGVRQGIDVRRHPVPKHRLGFDDALHEIATASRFRVRRIKLGDAWWKHDQGPILGCREGDEAPVALLPAGPNAYECVDPVSGKRTRVTANLALTNLSGFGYAFYTPLPSGKLGTREVVRFAVRGLELEFRTVALIVLGVGLLSIFTPLITGLVYDDAIRQAERDILLHLTLGLFLVALTAAAFQITQKVAVLRIQGKMGYSVQAAIWDRLLNLKMRFFRDYTAGDLADRTAGVAKIRNIIAGAGVSAILGAFTSLFNLVQMGFYSLTLAATAVSLSLLYAGLTLGASIVQVGLQRDELQRAGKIRGLVLQLIMGVAKLRVSGSEDLAQRVWATGFADQRRVSFRIGRVANFVAVLNSVFTPLATLVIFAVMYYLEQKAAASGETFDLTTGDFLAFSAAFGLFQAAMQALGDASVNLLMVIPTFERMQPILDAEPEIDDTKIAPGRLAGGIKISHIHFRYSDDSPWIFRDISLEARPGEFVAVVGSSGCGKSTLLRLMLGFERPNRGTVYYDGQDLSTLDIRMVRQQLGVVLQDSRIFPAEIYRNIVGARSRPVEEAWEAAHQAGLDGDIRMMPMNMHTYIGEGSGGLSEGQKQRLMIARALINRPAIIFLDEATRALDNQAQTTVIESMNRLGATRIVIAHRLSTIQSADRICYLEDGTIKEEGTFNELMALDGLFARMARRQLA